MNEALCAAEGYGVALFDVDGKMPFEADARPNCT